MNSVNSVALVLHVSVEVSKPRYNSVFDIWQISSGRGTHITDAGALVACFQESFLQTRCLKAIRESVECVLLNGKRGTAKINDELGVV